MMKLHFRAPTGTRIERTEQYVDAGREQHIREIVPAERAGDDQRDDRHSVVAEHRVRARRTTRAAWTRKSSSRSSPEHRPTAGVHSRICATTSRGSFPGSTVYFQTADIVSQVLNFGLSSPIDVQVEDSNLDEGYAVAQRAPRHDPRRCPARPTCTSSRCSTIPTLRLDVDRQRAAQVGMSTARRRQQHARVARRRARSWRRRSSSIRRNDVNYLVAVKAPLETHEIHERSAVACR